jgi:hypothetical protein
MSNDSRPEERHWQTIAIGGARFAFRFLPLWICLGYVVWSTRKLVDRLDRDPLESLPPSVVPYTEPPRPRPTWDSFDPAKIPSNPNYGDVPTISDEEFAPLAGDWILLEEWCDGRRVYPRGNDQKWDEIRYGVRIERNRLGFGRIRDTPELLAAPRRIALIDDSEELWSWQTSVIWGSHGKNLFSKATPCNPPAGERDLLVEMRAGMDYRGKFELDGNRLYLLEYVLPEMLSKYPMPDSIRVAPKIPAVFLWILERAESTLAIDFESCRLPTQEELRPLREARMNGQPVRHPDGRLEFSISEPFYREAPNIKKLESQK